MRMNTGLLWITLSLGVEKPGGFCVGCICTTQKPPGFSMSHWLFQIGQQLALLRWITMTLTLSYSCAVGVSLTSLETETKLCGLTSSYAMKLDQQQLGPATTCSISDVLFSVKLKRFLYTVLILKWLKKTALFVDGLFFFFIILLLLMKPIVPLASSLYPQ